MFWELTYRSDASTDFRALWLKRRGLAQGCPFWVYRSHCSPFRGIIPKNLNLGSMNRRFQAKLMKPKNMHIIKTTATIPIKFCAMIKTTKCPSRVVRTHTHNKSKMADGRLLGKIEKSPYLGGTLTDFDQIWQGEAVRLCSVA